MEGKKVPLYGDGKNIRDWVHVQDHNEAVDRIIHSGRIGETYCIGGESEKSNIEITRLILNSMGKGEEMIERVLDRPGHDRRYAINISKIRQELGWSPRIKLEDGIRETIKWYKNHEEWWRPLKDKSFWSYQDAQKMKWTLYQSQ
jgi:dTDP-glucose 4,6-dehydratase